MALLEEKQSSKDLGSKQWQELDLMQQELDLPAVLA